MYDIIEIQELVKKTAAPLPISKVILIGSYAKNEANDSSDIDLIIEGTDLSDAYWEFLFRMEDAVPVKIDLMTVKGLTNSCINNYSVPEGIVLYEA